MDCVSDAVAEEKEQQQKQHKTHVTAINCWQQALASIVNQCSITVPTNLVDDHQSTIPRTSCIACAWSTAGAVTWPSCCCGNATRLLTTMYSVRRRATDALWQEFHSSSSSSSFGVYWWISIGHQSHAVTIVSVTRRLSANSARGRWIAQINMINVRANQRPDLGMDRPGS